MATDESTSCTPYLKALADETRWSIVQTLLEQPQTVSQLVEGLGITQYNVSKHLRVLREAGIVAAHRSGRTVQARITPGFQTKVTEDRQTLNLGCCSFHFDRPLNDKAPA